MLEDLESESQMQIQHETNLKLQTVGIYLLNDAFVIQTSRSCLNSQVNWGKPEQAPH